MAPFPSTTDFSEKRRHVRQSSLQAARIHVGDSEVIATEIRDYCQTGVYLAFIRGRTPDAAVPAMVGTPVVVELGSGQTRGLEFAGRVARVSPHGLGVFVLSMPDGVLQVLRKGNGPIASPGSVPDANNPDIRQARVLKQECTTLFQTVLEAVMQDFFQRAEERLYEAGLDEMDFLERSRFDYAAQQLVRHRSRIKDEFFSGIRERIQNVDGSMDAPRATVTDESQDANALALVGEDEFEDWLNLSSIVRQVEEDIVVELDAFERRYSRLAHMRVNRKNNPFGPESIARAFQSTVQNNLDFTNPVRTVLYKALGQALSSRCSELYAQLNALLRALQPVESVNTSRDQGKPHTASATEPAIKTGMEEIDEVLRTLYPQDPAALTLSPENTDYSLDRILAGLGQSQRSRVGETFVHPADTRAAKGDSPSGVFSVQMAPRPELLQVVHRLQQTASQLSGRAEPDLPTFGEQGDGRPQVTLSELKRVLDSLPLTLKAAQDGVLPALSDQINTRIATQTGVARYLAPSHRQVLDAMSGLFTRARADMVPSSDIEILVKQLERPLLKLALQDAHFPGMPDHPARQVLNLIEQFAVAADDNGRFFDAKLKRFLFLLVDRVCKRADEDPTIFEAVRDNLEKVLYPIMQIRRTRIARMQEACEGRECIRTARSRVNEALEQRLAGREVPRILLRLLDAGWRQYLVLLEMRQGGQGDAWDAAFAVMDQLRDWLDPTHELIPHSAGAAGVLLGEIERTLNTTNVDTNLLAAFMCELGECLATDTAATSRGHAMVRVPPGRMSQSRQAGADLHARHHPWESRLRMGQWWDISVGERSVPMQLVWTSQPLSLCAFSNRSATHKLEFTLSELSRKIHSGVAKPGKDMGLPVIERSEHALFDETYQDLIHQVLYDPTTGLLNRKGFMQRLGLLGMPEQAGLSHTVGIIEFDQFRLIYNACGVEAVEDLASKLAHATREKMGQDAAIASFRDDTLAILLPNCARTAGHEVIETLLGEMKDFHFQHGPHSYSIGFNIGITEFSPAQNNPADAIRRADSACITAKSLGRNRLQIYEETSPQLETQESLMVWAGRIDSFLNGKGLHLRCQHVMPLNTEAGLQPYYEILLGIEDEEGRDINPMHFIPAVERLQRAHEIDIWVIRKVFEWIGTNRKQFDALGGFAINLSAMSLSSPEVIRFLHTALQASDFPATKLTFEITETAAIGSYGAAQDFIREIRRYGCKFALDDFGSGFTSYAHLKNLRTDSLKIDGSFVKDMLNNPGDYAMVKSMNDIGHSLGLRTVAEYVESPMLLDALREIGIDYAQGYAVHRPCRIEDIPG